VGVLVAKHWLLPLLCTIRVKYSCMTLEKVSLYKPNNV
jgi:hypothetical protein